MYVDYLLNYFAYVDYLLSYLLLLYFSSIIYYIIIIHGSCRFAKLKFLCGPVFQEKSIKKTL